MANPSAASRMKSHCNRCGGERNHEVLYHHQVKESESNEALEITINWQNDYYFLQCAGCGAVSLRQDDWNDLFESGTTKLLPSPSFRPKPEWMSRPEFKSACPKQLSGLVDEIYVSLQTDCYRSAAMAIRAVLETVMLDKVGDHGSFSANLREFVQQGFLSSRQRSVIEPVLEAGHAATHRNFEPAKDHLVVLVDVMESVLATTYLHPVTTAALQKKVPSRKISRNAPPKNAGNNNS